MIPKIIHYCWFGGARKSQLINKCINSWKKQLSDFTFMEWNEESFDINCNDYVKEAYEKKKYAFVSDYVRLYALYNYGGIYLDTDVEVIKPIYEYVRDYKRVLAFESDSLLLTAFMAFDVKDPIVDEFLSQYKDLHFINEDASMNMVANTVRLTEIMKNKGLILNGEKQLVGDTLVYPNEYFGALDVTNTVYTTTKNTVLIHHADASWRRDDWKIYLYQKTIKNVVKKYKIKKRVKSFLRYLKGMKK